MPAYEYTTAAISHGLMGRKAEEVDREELQKVLNQHGAEGWELDKLVLDVAMQPLGLREQVRAVDPAREQRQLVPARQRLGRHVPAEEDRAAEDEEPQAAARLKISRWPSFSPWKDVSSTSFSSSQPLAP